MHISCGETSFISHQGHDLVVARFRCKSWTCPHCAPKRLKRLAKEAYLGRPTKFLTLTARAHDGWTPDEAAASLVESWKRMREAIQERFNTGIIPFIAVFERHKSGWPHLHILFRGPYIPQRWISRYMARRIDSPIVDIRAIKSRKRAAAYVAKYISKAPDQFRGRKRYWRNSPYLPPLEKRGPSPHQWDMVATSLDQYAVMYDLTEHLHDTADLERINIPLEPP